MTNWLEKVKLTKIFVESVVVNIWFSILMIVLLLIIPTKKIIEFKNEQIDDITMDDENIYVLKKKFVFKCNINSDYIRGSPVELQWILTW